MSEMIECPGEAHELDNTFNPTTQGPYGANYHDCEWCEGEGEITEQVYEEWKKYQKQLDINRKNAKLVRKLMQSKEANI